MTKHTLRTRLALCVAVAAALTACGSDSKNSTAPTTTAAAVSTTQLPADTTTASASSAPDDTTANSTSDSGDTTTAPVTDSSAVSSTDDSQSGLLPDNGDCDASSPVYKVGIITVIDSPTLSLGDDSKGLKAAIDAFNKRGGISGHCMKLTICDSQADPNKEVDCARQFVADGVVATLSDVTPINTQATKEVLEAANIPRIGISPGGVPDLGSTVAYPFDAGAAGTAFMSVPGCVEHGDTKLAAIHADLPGITPLLAGLEPMLKAHGATLDTKIPVPVGTTDYQQFVLGAENAGATCAVVLLDPSGTLQVLQAAQQLGSKLVFSVPPTSADNMTAFGDFAPQVYFASALPPATASQEQWPILGDIIRDLAPAGLTATQLTTGPMRSWLATYALVTIVEKYGTPDDISSAAITAALKSAKDVDMFGLIPPWTPSFSVMPGSPFSAVSQPWYYIAHFDADGKVVIADKRYNVLNELGGKVDYDQPGTSSPDSTSPDSTVPSSSSGG